MLVDDSESTRDHDTAEPQPPSTAPTVCVPGGMAEKVQKKGKTVATFSPPSGAPKVSQGSSKVPAPASPVLPVPKPNSTEITIHVKGDSSQNQHGKGASYKKQWNGGKWDGKGKGRGKSCGKGQNSQWQSQN